MVERTSDFLHWQSKEKARTRRFEFWLNLAIVFFNVCLFAFAIHGLYDSRQQTEERVKGSVTTLASLLERNIDDSARRIDLALLAITDFLEHMQGDGGFSDAAVEALLATHLSRHPEVDAFRVSDAQGVLRWGHGLDRRAPVSLADQPFFVEHRAAPGQRMISNGPLIGRVSRMPVLAFTRSFRRPDGSFAGVVTAAVPVEHFTGLISRLDPGPHGTAVIRRDDFALVTRYPALPGNAGEPGSR